MYTFLGVERGKPLKCFQCSYGKEGEYDRGQRECENLKSSDTHSSLLMECNPLLSSSCTYIKAVGEIIVSCINLIVSNKNFYYISFVCLIISIVVNFRKHYFKNPICKRYYDVFRHITNIRIINLTRLIHLSNLYRVLWQWQTISFFLALNAPEVVEWRWVWCQVNIRSMT